MEDSGSAFARFGVTGGEFQFELVLGGAPRKLKCVKDFVDHPKVLECPAETRPTEYDGR